MRDEDLKEFEKWHNKNIANPPTLNELINKAWTDACLYKQKEIDRIKADSLNHLIIERFMEHNEKLQAENDILKKEIDELYKHLKDENDLYKKHLKIYEDENSKLRECVEFYAEPWERGELDGELLIRKIESYDPFVEVHYKARQVLKELDEKL